MKQEPEEQRPTGNGVCVVSVSDLTASGTVWMNRLQWNNKSNEQIRGNQTMLNIPDIVCRPAEFRDMSQVTPQGCPRYRTLLQFGRQIQELWTWHHWAFRWYDVYVWRRRSRDSKETCQTLDKQAKTKRRNWSLAQTPPMSPYSWPQINLPGEK